MRGRGSGRKFFAVWLCHLPSCRLRQVTVPLWSYGELCENRIFLLEACSWFLACHLSVPLCVYLPKAESGVCVLEQTWVLEMQSEGSQFSPSLSTEPAVCVSLQLQWRLFSCNFAGLSAWIFHIHCSYNSRTVFLFRRQSTELLKDSLSD